VSEIRFLDPSEAERPYAELLLAGKSLQPAVASVGHAHHYEGVRDLAVLAGRLLHRVNDAHALVDGNKRASVSLTDRFLALNRHRLEGAEDELVELVWAVAAKGLDEREAVDRLRALIVQGAPGAVFEERYPGVMERLAQ
jgi:prophage maintenance system killer protein